MGKLLATNRNALRFLMTEELYDLKEPATPELSNSPAVALPAITNEIAVPSPQTGRVPHLKEQANTPDKPGINIGNTMEDVSPADFDYLGENNRYFLILVNDPIHAQLNTPHKDMLVKIMAAKKLEIRDLAIVNLAKYPKATFDQLKDFFSCSKITLFGIDPRTIGLPAIGANQPEKYQEVKVLATFSLDEMSTSVDKKREFWNVMKDF